MSCSSSEVLPAPVDRSIQNHDVNATAPMTRNRRRHGDRCGFNSKLAGIRSLRRRSWKSCNNITSAIFWNPSWVQVDHRTIVQYLLRFIVLLACAFVANCAGGVFARRVIDRKHLALAFSAGTVLAIAFFIFMPEAILSGSATRSADQLLLFVGLGFVIALLLDRFGFLWIAESGWHRAIREHQAHGVLNGAAIGIAYHVSPGVTGLVAAALLAHEFSDSADVMSELREQQPGSALRASSISSLCFAAGLAATSLYSVTPAFLSAELAVFGGYFIYLSASDLIPESHHAHPQLLTVGMTFAGAGALYLASYVLDR